MYTICNRIYEILDSQFIYQTRHSVHMMYIIARWIFTILEIQFVCKSNHSVHIMYTISRWVSIVGTFRFSTNPNIPCKYNVQNFLFNLCNSRYSISLQIRTFRTFNVHNFPLNFRSSRQSIFQKIQTFCKNIMYTVSCRIYAVLDVQFFCKSRHSVHISYTISRRWKSVV